MVFRIFKLQARVYIEQVGVEEDYSFVEAVEPEGIFSQFVVEVEEEFVFVEVPLQQV